MLFTGLSCTVLISQDRNSRCNSCLNKLVWLISPTGINISAALSLFERYLHHKGIVLSRPVKFEVLVAHRHFLSQLLSWTETSQRNKPLLHHITVICISICIFFSFCSCSLDLFLTCGEYDTDLYPAEFTSKKRNEFPWYILGRGGKPRLACRAILTPACEEILLVSKRGLETQPWGNRELCRKINNIQELYLVNLSATAALCLEAPDIQIFPCFCCIQYVCFVLLWSEPSRVFCTSDLCCKWRSWCFLLVYCVPHVLRQGEKTGKDMERRCSDTDSPGQSVRKKMRGNSDGKEI